MKSLFDLNIEKVLEHWELEHAVREIIANALDEKLLTNTKNIEIYQKDNEWHIRDYGRGLTFTHFTQNENTEKLKSPHLIGKFGVGLKDALAVFYRKGITVEINSKYAHITMEMANKSGFEVQTLNAAFESPLDESMVGTDFIIKGLDVAVIEKAKEMFLCFSSTELLERTRYGEVYKEQGINSIYINGVRVATEPNFLFSYNITNINARIKKALNRERTNVGRTAYTDSVKSILKQCSSDKVLGELVKDIQNIMSGLNKDESTWTDITAYAAQTLNNTGNVVFMTPSQRAQMDNGSVEILEESGKTLIMVTDTVLEKIKGKVTTFKEVYHDYLDSFQYEFVNYNQLTENEKIIFDTRKPVLKFMKKHNYNHKVEIKISETIKSDLSGVNPEGVWDKSENAIIIKRDVLRKQSSFLGTLAHEIAHFTSDFDDNTREFENVLTEMLGYSLEEILISQSKSDSKSDVAEINNSQSFLRRIFNR